MRANGKDIFHYLSYTALNSTRYRLRFNFSLDQKKPLPFSIVKKLIDFQPSFIKT